MKSELDTKIWSFSNKVKLSPYSAISLTMLTTPQKHLTVARKLDHRFVIHPPGTCTDAAKMHHIRNFLPKTTQWWHPRLREREKCLKLRYYETESHKLAQKLSPQRCIPSARHRIPVIRLTSQQPRSIVLTYIHTLDQPIRLQSKKNTPTTKSTQTFAKVSKHSSLRGSSLLLSFHVVVIKFRLKNRFSHDICSQRSRNGHWENGR